jgi:hypothetical protein
VIFLVPFNSISPCKNYDLKRSPGACTGCH